MDDNTQQLKKGRPRSDASRRAVLDAAWALLQSRSVDLISVDLIAEHAGVSKATIYRWWSNKVEVLLDAFVEAASPIAMDTTGMRPLTALRERLQRLLIFFQGDGGRIAADLIAHGRNHPETMAAYIAKFIEPRRALARVHVEAAKESGDINADIDTEAFIDMLYGPLYFRLLVGHQPLNHELPAQLVDMALLGVRI